ncbi:hypothetical protein Tco_0267681 [Tanacetum coccineum]
MLLRQLSWMSLEQQSYETDHLDWLLKTVVVEEDLKRNQRFLLERKPLMHQTVVEEEVVEEATQAGFSISVMLQHALKQNLLHVRRREILEASKKEGLSLHAELMRLESPIGGPCSLACLAFPPRLDLHPPDLLYSVPADQMSELRSRLRRLVVVKVVVVEQLLLLLLF